MAKPNPPTQDSEFWLPSEFITVDNKKKLCFPSEFPYETKSVLYPSFLNSPVESSAGSTESESDDYEDDFITGLTRHLARSTLQGEYQISPTPQNLESTLSTFGSLSGWSPSSNGSSNGPSQVPSPRTTTFGGTEDAWDMIYSAGSEVAKLKINGGGISYEHAHQSLSKTNHQFGHDQVHKPSSGWSREGKHGWYPQVQQSHNGWRMVDFGGDGGRCGRPLGLPQSAWPPLVSNNQHHRNPTQQQSGSGMRGVFLSGSDGVKKECAGTGVFLPRKYGNTTDSLKKPGCSTALLPARVVQALNKNFDDMTANVQPKPHLQPQSRFNGGFIPDYDDLMARRNALLAQQKRRICPDGAMNHEIRLPQEWTY